MHTVSHPAVLSTVKDQPRRGVAGDARTTSRRRPRAPGFRRSPLLALIIALLATVTGPGTAWAHVGLRSSIPARAATLTVAPRELRLVFSEAPELAVARIALIGPDGQPVALGPLTIATDRKDAIVVAIAGGLTAGTYQVRWQIAGADGHPIRGEFPFTIVPHASGLTTAPPAAGATGGATGEAGAGVTPPGQTPVPAMHHDPSTMPSNIGGFDAESPAYVVIRWLLFSALLVVVGALAFQFAVLGFLRRKQLPVSPMVPDARSRAAVIGLWGAAALVPIALLRLYAQSYALHGADAALNADLVTAMLGRTTWGWGWLLQLAGAVIAAAGFAMARRARREAGSGAASGPGWTVAALGGLVLAFTPALAGHASSAPQLKGLAILADGLHVIGAGGWLGSLLFVLAAGVPAALRLAEVERGPAVASLINAFSPTALIFAGLVGVTGVFAGWLHVGELSALWQTGYGRMLLLKLGVLSIVALTGAYNWLRVKPTLGTIEGARRMKRSAGLELGVTVVVLVVTAILVATPTPMDAKMTMPDGMEMSQPAGPVADSAPMRR